MPQQATWWLRFKVKNIRLSDIRRQAGEKLDNQMEADILISHALQKDRSFLYAHDKDELTDAQLTSIHHLIKRRQLGEPVAYLLGHKEFYGRSFKVTPAVLIPRPETEMIIEQIHGLTLPQSSKVLDVGTGSGCIGLTLAADHPSWVVCVSDISEAALEVCKENRQAMNLTNVVIRQGSLLEPWRGQTFDLIVANLPYIAPDDHHLEEGDLRYEPKTALIANNRGQALIRELIEKVPQHLNRGGHLILEHGYDQQPGLMAALLEAGLTDVSGISDLSGHPRLVMGHWTRT